MSNLKTIEEKSLEWGITARYIQHLCRTGKIEGAVKRVGAWFIPDNAPNPVKNTKSDDKPFKFVGTKKKIFDNSIKLFTLKGYENVSLNDIANAIGIRQSAVYNHFKSKQGILDTIYDFYCYHFILNRMNMDDFDELLQTGTLMEIIIRGFRYDFDNDVLEQMADACKIIVQRMIVDKRAREIFQTLILEGGVKFVEEGFNRAVEMGRFAPFDTHTASIVINSIRLYTLYWWLLDPPEEVFAQLMGDEQRVYNRVSELITDLKPPLRR